MSCVVLWFFSVFLQCFFIICTIVVYWYGGPLFASELSCFVSPADTLACRSLSSTVDFTFTFDPCSSSVETASLIKCFSIVLFTFNVKLVFLVTHTQDLQYLTGVKDYSLAILKERIIKQPLSFHSAYRTHRNA